jgi:hypothetical protein
MEAACRICGVGRKSVPSGEPCTACGALPFLGWAPDLHVERGEAHVVVVFPPDLPLPGLRLVAWSIVLPGLVACFFTLVRDGALKAAEGFALMGVLVGVVALLWRLPTRKAVRVEIRAGEIVATSGGGGINQRCERIPLSQIEALYAGRSWSRVRGESATLTVKKTSGEYVWLFDGLGSDALVVSAEQVIRPYLTKLR